MRELDTTELGHVAGGTEIIAGFGDTGGTTTPPPSTDPVKNNNGYGNGAEAGPAPGQSGEHNPTLLEANLGPRGVR